MIIRRALPRLAPRVAMQKNEMPMRLDLCSSGTLHPLMGEVWVVGW